MKVKTKLKNKNRSKTKNILIFSLDQVILSLDDYTNLDMEDQVYGFMSIVMTRVMSHSLHYPGFCQLGFSPSLNQYAHLQFLGCYTYIILIKRFFFYSFIWYLPFI